MIIECLSICSLLDRIKIIIVMVVQSNVRDFSYNLKEKNYLKNF